MSAASFRPLRWLRSPHLQTIGAAVPLFTSAPERSVVTVEDLRIPVAHRAGGPPDHKLHARAWWADGVRPAVLILHGIAGSKDSHCAVRAAVAMHRSGYHTIRLDMRSAGESVVDAPSLYHAGLTLDLDAAVRHLGKDPRVSGVLVLGFSGGGSQALKLAGEWGNAPPPGVLAVATISAPLDYTRVAARMDTLACLPYRFHVLRGLLDRAHAFAIHHPARAHYRPSDLAAIRRFRSFDGDIIVPMHGFEDVDDYYWEASSGRWLDRIRVPTLIIHSEDDPMVPIATVRPWLEIASPAVKVSLSKHGGHIGWLGGLDEASWIKGWATREALGFFAERALPPQVAPRVSAHA